VKVGDLIRHTKTGWSALVIQMPPSTSDIGQMDVWTWMGPGRWSVSMCEVINASR